jgi:hypothetical protein
MVALLLTAVAGWTWGCTSALVGASRSLEGRWMLWKHRDSGHPDNYVKNFAATDSTKAYVALFNSSDTNAEEAWIGFNDSGFAVMNTASYNLPEPQEGWKDREGLLMTDALQHCRTIADFYAILSNRDSALGVQANFGAFDAEGHGAYFEASDWSVDVFPLDSVSAVALGVELPLKAMPDSVAPGFDGILTRTNYSMAGGTEKCLGMSRHCSEKYLLDSIIAERRPWAPAGRLAPEDFIETMSRSMYLPAEGIDLLDGRAASYPDRGDVISRRSSCASVVIEGPHPGEDPAKAMIMWTSIGFPTLSVVEAVKLDSVPAVLQPGPNGHSRRCDETNGMRNQAFQPVVKQGHKKSYNFNMEYLRLMIPQRRDVSLRKYAPARARRQ